MTNTHFHANTRSTIEEAFPLGDSFATMEEARTALLREVGSWVGGPGSRLVTDCTPWDSSIFTVTAYNSKTGEERTFSAWGCTCGS